LETEHSPAAAAAAAVAAAHASIADFQLEWPTAHPETSC